MSSVVNQVDNQGVDRHQLFKEVEKSINDDWNKKSKEDEEELQEAMNRCLYPWHDKNNSKVSSLSQNILNHVNDSESSSLSQ